MKQFSFQHDAALAVMVIAIVGSVWGARRHPGRWMKPFSVGLAAWIFAAWAGEYVADVILGNWSLKYTLPLQLTDAVSVVSILALLTRRQMLVELTYFWTFTASLQAVITPDLAYAFPSVYYFTYFIYHVGAIVAAAYLVVGCRLYPRPGAAWRVFACTLAWAAIAGAGDLITGGNYMYLRAKPVHTSLLSVLGPWPWYIVGAAAVGLAMLLAIAGLTRLFGGVPEPAAAMEPGESVLVR
ncbi:MAG TPA: TIGR02206 family membrane protein [Solirubrobacteraceae bacterium]|nr:TIGR02206 family membrane protein [Solirubrobacteraceae bacterium]